MKRFFYLVVPMLLSSSAHAGNSLSFTVAGHRIHVEAPRHCRSVSCLSVSIPGIYATRRSRDPDRDRDDAAPAKPVAAASVPQPASAPASVAPAPPPATMTLAAATTRVVAPPAPPIEPPRTAPMTSAPPTTGSIIVMPAPQRPVEPPPAPSPIAAPAVAAPVAPVAAPVSKISRDTDEAPVATPLGDWQTEGKKGSVRIEPCGHALCGYVIDPASNAAGQTLLVNMKPKASDKPAADTAASAQANTEWSGNIFSRNSGNSYYATMKMKDANSLRVEACALGRFFCSGNLWTRVSPQPDKLITSRQLSQAPPS
jgi:uncharacterized protein (DUF2147 family)